VGYKHLTPDIRRAVIRLAGQGLSVPEILERVEVSERSVFRIVSPLGGVIRSDMWQPVAGKLSAEERVEIRLGLERGWSLTRIAEALGRAPSTVCREVNNNGGRQRYRPLAAHHAACERRRRPKPTKLAQYPALRRRVIRDLRRLWSPQQIGRHLRCEFGDDATMTISHETIYKSLYVQGRGELRKELARCLRSGRAKRRPQGRIEARNRIADMVMISERPAEVEDRAVPGHWEGDLLIGKDNASAIGTLVERSTRFVMLLHLPNGYTADEVRTAMTSTIKTLPAALRRSVTWDQGSEMAGHAQFSVDTGVQVYFCDPRSPWQRGSNENTNGLLRQYFPKGTDFTKVTRRQLNAAADSLNGRPRMTLEWMTPSEKLAQVIATTG